MIYLNDHLELLDVERALPLLSEQRRQQALAFRHDLGRRTCVAAYLLLCEGLRRECGMEEPPVFSYGEHGKPFIVGHPDICFNMSHCREAAICVIDDKPVGVDIESMRGYRESLVRYTMSDEEVRQIAAAPQPELEFVRLWTMKEAVQKLSGEGIRSDMKTILQQRGSRVDTVVSPDSRYVYSVAYSD